MDISYLLLFIIVSIIIFYFLDKAKKNYSEKFKLLDTNIGFDINKQIYDQPKLISRKLKTIPKSKYNPLRENDLQTQFYINKNILGRTQKPCPKPIQTPEEFNNDFFKFRDYTYNDSAIREDPVDKMNELQQSNYNGFHDKPIQEIYDMIAAGPVNLYKNPDARKTYYDNTMNDGYDFCQLSNLYNNRDEWFYYDEKVMNGGLTEMGIYGDDPETLKEFPILNYMP
jgi:hypothetical protein